MSDFTLEEPMTRKRHSARFHWMRLRPDWSKEARKKLKRENAPVTSAYVPEQRTSQFYAFLFHHIKNDPEVSLSSDTNVVLENPAFKLIIQLGQQSVPFLLQEYQKEDGYWSIALEKILNENPVPAESIGDSEAIRQTWLKWGQDNGFLPCM